MDKYIYIVLLTTCSFFIITSCGDSFLDKPPYGSLTDQNFFKTEAEAFQALTACYSSFGGEGGEFETNLFEFGDVASDDSYKGGESDNDRPFTNDMAYFRAVSNNQMLENFWRRNYEGIYRCNQVISRVPEIVFEDNILKNRYIAEAKFLRAYFLFNLTRVFGGIPILDKPIVFPGDNVIVPRSSEEDVHAFLRKDLNELIPDLPEKKSMNMDKEWGRTSKGGALGLLARIELYYGSYQEAKEAAFAIISSNQYSLDPSWENIFFKPNAISEESVLEVLHQDTDGKGDATIIATYCRSRGCGGWGFNCPTQDLVDEFEIGDARILYTITETGDKFPKKDGGIEIQNHTGCNKLDLVVYYCSYP